jgi:hypothetical protein
MNEKQTRRSLFGRLRVWLFGERTETYEAPPTQIDPIADPVSVSERRNSKEPLTVPADGGVLTFLVDYELTFSACGLSQESLAARVEACWSSAERTVLNRIWPVGRDHMPQNPGDAEKAMNKALKPNWCYDEKGHPQVSCDAKVYVRLAADVIEKQTPLWHRLVELDAHRQVELQRLSVVEDLLTRWVKLVESFGSGPAVVNAARIVDTDFARVLQGLAQDRISTAQELAQVLHKAREAHQFVGLYEFANAYDKALHSFELQAGLKPGSVVPNAMEGAE